ncbi:MAG: helix-turn-helix domain-containing protein [Clostridia bacterium]|nr:helix-turn-helix domain-containing protein [Clostridia bacterium]
MLISKLNPFIRYARFINLTNISAFENVISLDNRLFYACNGFGKIIVNGIEYEMNEGDLLIIRAGNPYHILTPPIKTTYIAINFDFTQQSAAQTKPVVPVAYTNFSKDLLIENTDIFSGVFYKKGVGTVYKKLSSIVKEYSEKKIYYEQKISCTLTECIIDSMRDAENNSSASENEAMTKLFSYLQANYNKPIDNRTIGDYLGYHPNYISFLTKKITGLSLHQYLLNLRLTNALSLLENTALSIEEIAFCCGFFNSAHFSKCFKKRFSTPPSKCRNV